MSAGLHPADHLSRDTFQDNSPPTVREADLNRLKMPETGIPDGRRLVSLGRVPGLPRGEGVQ